MRCPAAPNDAKGYMPLPTEGMPKMLTENVKAVCAPWRNYTSALAPD